MGELNKQMEEFGLMVNDLGNTFQSIKDRLGVTSIAVDKLVEDLREQ